MKLTRRKFIKIGAGASALAGMPALMAGKNTPDKIVILHTNDVHSQIEPIPLSSKYHAGMGGFAKRAEIVQQIRDEEENVILLDAGDFFQGTPYFNFFKGELEVKLMNQLKYDAVTIGNHEFDNGVDALYNQLKNAKFQVLNANYSFEEDRWKNLVHPYTILHKGRHKVGIIGLGISPDGLIAPVNFEKVTFLQPLKILNQTAEQLSKECDVVIALTHLGIETDRILAKNSENVDIILGGHSHTFLEEPELIPNKVGKNVILNQVGDRGIFLGRIDLYFDTNQTEAKVIRIDNK